MLYFEDFKVGQQFCSARMQVSAAEIINFAQQFDPQPFHLNAELAKQTLFKGLIASGWHTAALTMKLMLSSGLESAEGMIGLGMQELNWLLPVRPGDSLWTRSEIIKMRVFKSKPDYGIVTLLMETLNQHAEVVQSAIAKVMIKRAKLVCAGSSCAASN